MENHAANHGRSAQERTAETVTPRDLNPVAFSGNKKRPGADNSRPLATGWILRGTQRHCHVNRAPRGDPQKEAGSQRHSRPDTTTESVSTTERTAGSTCHAPGL